ncbi:MAG: energy transducer TonB [Gammaproteobacteria bacterium]|nr:energy transducer TonB [Gammaproteobacteria bacterium]
MATPQATNEKTEKNNPIAPKYTKANNSTSSAKTTVQESSTLVESNTTLTQVAEEIESSEWKNEVKAELSESLKLYFHYPRAARKRNWQGKVILALNIHANGQITDLQIARSSGYEILDNAAISAISKTAKLQNIALLEERMETNEILSLHVPIIYKLR